MGKLRFQKVEQMHEVAGNLMASRADQEYFGEVTNLDLFAAARFDPALFVGGRNYSRVGSRAVMGHIAAEAYRTEDSPHELPADYDPAMTWVNVKQGEI